MKNFIKKMQTKSNEKKGGTNTVEILVIILVILVILGAVFMPGITKIMKKGMTATEQKMDEIIQYVG
ncbi:MAG: hypothetical protein RR728_08595 [Oscillospiraceae bacterium]